MDENVTADNVDISGSEDADIEAVTPTATDEVTEIDLDGEVKEEVKDEPKKDTKTEPVKEDKLADNLTNSFSKRLAKARESDQRMINELQAEVKKYKSRPSSLELLKSYGYEGETEEEVFENYYADKKGITVEEYREQQKAKAEAEAKAVEEHPAVKEAKELLAKQREEQARRMLFDEVETIQKLYPDAEIKTPNDLGRVYYKHIENGLSSEEAFLLTHKELALKSVKTEPKKIVPPIIGSTAGTGNQIKNFISRDEALAMTPEEEAQFHDIIAKSMPKWS